MSLHQTVTPRWSIKLLSDLLGTGHTLSLKVSAGNLKLLPLQVS